jgi:hypothetical protein
MPVRHLKKKCSLAVILPKNQGYATLVIHCGLAKLPPVLTTMVCNSVREQYIKKSKQLQYDGNAD